MSDMIWRYFQSKELSNAKKWAVSGGIAVHENIFDRKHRPSAHIFASDRESLKECAELLGISERRIHCSNSGHVHLDVWYNDYYLAIEKCQ